MQWLMEQTWPVAFVLLSTSKDSRPDLVTSAGERLKGKCRAWPGAFEFA